MQGSHLVEGLIDIFSGFFSKREKAVLSKWGTFSVLWSLLSPGWEIASLACLDHGGKQR